jgi:hypothetical protein
MELKSQVLVLGAKFFKGEIEGSQHDNTKLFVCMPVADKNATAYGRCGYDAVDVKFGKADEYHKLAGLPFPLQAELTLKLTTEGYECVGFRALQQQPRQAQG